MSLRRVLSPHCKLHIPGHSDVQDRSGYGNHGTWSGTEAYADGPFGRSCLSMASSSIGVSDDTSIRFGTGDFSIAMWMYVNAAGTNRDILNKTGTGYYDVIKATNELLRFRVSDGSNTATCTSSRAIRVGSWEHAVFVCERGDNLRLYLNGSLDRDDGATSSIGDISNTSDMYLFGNGAVADWAGYGADVRFYSCALQGDEVVSLYRWSKLHA